MLKNLLSNAVKFTDAGPRQPRHRPRAGGHCASRPTTLDRGGRGASRSRSSDTGIGIADDKLQLIFEAFQQADGTTSRSYGGTGLGLSISREIARLLGGEIRVERGRAAGARSRSSSPAATSSSSGTGLTPSPREARSLAEELTALATPPPVDVEAVLAAPAEVPDDRDELEPGDRVVLIVEDDADFAGIVLDMARERGFKGVVALRGDSALALAHEVQPDAIVLDIELPVLDGHEVLDQLKRHPETRHIPVHIVSARDGQHRACSAPAPSRTSRSRVTKELLDEPFGEHRELPRPAVKRLLVVEDDETPARRIASSIGASDVEITGSAPPRRRSRALEERPVDCMVLDLKLPDKSGFELLEKVKEDERWRDLPVIIYTGKDLTRREETRLRKYAETIIVKDVSSPERLLDETALFLHRVEARLPAGEAAHARAAPQRRRRVPGQARAHRRRRRAQRLLPHERARGPRHGGAFAENGKEALEMLRERPGASTSC